MTFLDETLKLDLDDPRDARTFLSRLWHGDRQVEGVFTTGSAGFKRFDTMNDEERVHFAKQLWIDWMGKGDVEYREVLPV